jgi:transcriptional regulator with XRE-family HTH domain
VVKARVDERDKVIGRRIHFLRISEGMSRVHVADKIGVSHQQFQKYERGENRLAIGRAYDIAKALGVGINDLLPDELCSPVHKDKISSLAWYYWKNMSASQRRKILALMREFLGYEIEENINKDSG